MNGPRGHIALQTRLDRVQNRATIGLFTKTQHLEKHCLLEGSKDVRHSAYIVGIRQGLSIGSSNIAGAFLACAFR